MRLAAAVAFYTIMSLAPLLVVALNVLSLHYGKQAEAKIGQQVNTFVGSQQAASPGSGFHDLLHYAAHSRHGRIAIILSFAVALISGSTLFVALQDSLNQIWDIKPRPGMTWKIILRHRIVAGGMVLVSAILLLGSFLITASLSVAVHQLGAKVSHVSYLADSLASFIISLLLFASIFKVLPDVTIEWPDIWFGAGVTAVLFVAGKFGLTVYFRLAAVTNPYGAAGSLSALLIWVYYSAALMFLGAAFTRAHTESHGKPIRVNAYAMKR
jgi:membrane protein